MKTNSYFVEIVENSNGKYIRRRKRKGIRSYPRTLSFKQIYKILSASDILYPKMIKNHFNYIDEEYINSTDDIKNISTDKIINYFIDVIKKLNDIKIDEYRKMVSWRNNSEFMLFQINNFKEALKLKKSLNLDELEKQIKTIDLCMDNNRKLSFIHGDLHLNNIIINNNRFYLIDWEMATIGDLAYELALHFILMNYTESEEKDYINKIISKSKINKDKLIHDIKEYKKFELIRRIFLHGNTENHYH